MNIFCKPLPCCFHGDCDGGGGNGGVGCGGGFHGGDGCGGGGGGGCHGCGGCHGGDGCGLRTCLFISIPKQASVHSQVCNSILLAMFVPMICLVTVYVDELAVFLFSGSTLSHCYDFSCYVHSLFWLWKKNFILQ